MTEEGAILARDIVRRHRLAETLLFNILHMDRIRINKDACELEHILTQEATDKICTFLGHPKICPHGKDIPSGECCKHER
ncbi:MAG: iron dependent repressor, metal binding and dimerization domain protein [Candidatus Omnitrophota bacterium]|nr:iron dependent repressor, metal binding and dimerization domain protein [Candidatus Omnitrophota bacterium]